MCYTLKAYIGALAPFSSIYRLYFIGGSSSSFLGSKNYLFIILLDQLITPFLIEFKGNRCYNLNRF